MSAGRRLVVVLVVAGGWLALIAGRLVDLQLIEHDEYLRKARRQQQRVIDLDPSRGTFYDAAGRELAVSVEVESAWADPAEVVEPAATARAVARVVEGVDVRRLAAQLADRDRGFVWVARKLDPPVADRLRRLALPGLSFERESKRYYPNRELAAAVLGYVGTDNHGLGGLEAFYEDRVAGRAGQRTVLRDARQATVVVPRLRSAEPEAGHDLQLTIDATAQYFAERELARAVEAHHAKAGTAILLDPWSGAVLAMATYPGFDPNRFTEFAAERWRNQVVMDAYEPGSTFKMVTAAAALAANVLDPNDVLDCEMGAITLAGTRIRDHKPFGRLSLREVIARSSNVGAIKTGLRVGRQRLYETIRAFGFGSTTGIDLPGESPGLLTPIERWWTLSEAYISFGQEVSVTPLQLAVAFAAVANGGSLVRPYVVAGAVGPDGTRVERPQPVERGRPLAESTAREVERLLEAVVTDGTGKAADIPGFPVAGKTGTAQKAIPGGGYAPNRYVASFVGFAPARNPRVVAAVVLDEPWPRYHGGEAAAPAFRAMVEPVLLYLGVEPERERPERWPGEPGIQVAAGPARPPAPEIPEETW